MSIRSFLKFPFRTKAAQVSFSGVEQQPMDSSVKGRDVLTRSEISQLLDQELRRRKRLADVGAEGN
ncbi:MAG: hypothetical protein AB3N22_15080 [Ruegeria sp.]